MKTFSLGEDTPQQAGTQKGTELEVGGNIGNGGQIPSLLGQESRIVNLLWKKLSRCNKEIKKTKTKNSSLNHIQVCFSFP